MVNIKGNLPGEYPRRMRCIIGNLLGEYPGRMKWGMMNNPLKIVHIMFLLGYH